MRLAQFSVAVCAGLLITGALGSVSAFAEGQIGVASVINNQVEGRGARRLAVGSEVFGNERIRTGDASTAQLMFLDKTVLSLGPKSELILDKYVYNPNRGTGQVVVNAVQGSMRFVTGAQNPTNYAVKTPVANSRYSRDDRASANQSIRDLYRRVRRRTHGPPA